MVTVTRNSLVWSRHVLEDLPTIRGPPYYPEGIGAQLHAVMATFVRFMPIGSTIAQVPVTVGL